MSPPSSRSQMQGWSKPPAAEGIKKRPTCNRLGHAGVLLVVNPPTSEQSAENLDQAFPQFVDVHASMALTLAARLTDTHTGQDINQEVFPRTCQAISGRGQTRTLQLSATQLPMRPTSNRSAPMIFSTRSWSACATHSVLRWSFAMLSGFDPRRGAYHGGP